MYILQTISKIKFNHIHILIQVCKVCKILYCKWHRHTLLKHVDCNYIYWHAMNNTLSSTELFNSDSNLVTFTKFPSVLPSLTVHCYAFFVYPSFAYPPANCQSDQVGPAQSGHQLVSDVFTRCHQLHSVLAQGVCCDWQIRGIE